MPIPIFFVPLGLIFLLIFCGIGLAAEAIQSFLDALPFILAAIVVSLVVLAIHCLARAFRAKRPTPLYSISEFIMILSVTVGLFAFAGPTSLDHCHRWLSWFGDSLAVQIVTYISIVILANLIFMILAYLVPVKAISSLLLLVPIALPFALYGNALSVCAESYSDYIATEFSSMDSIQEYRVTEETKIYYPDIWRGQPRIPALLPVKYTTDTFSEGDIIYTVYNSIEYYKENGNAYAIVSDGTKGGMVAVTALETVDTPQYRYDLQTKADTALYEAHASVFRSSYAENGSFNIWSRTDNVLSTLPAGQPLTLSEDGIDEVDSTEAYLRIRLSDGTEGYIAREDIAVIRTPIS